MSEVMKRTVGTQTPLVFLQAAIDERNGPATTICQEDTNHHHHHNHVEEEEVEVHLHFSTTATEHLPDPAAPETSFPSEEDDTVPPGEATATLTSPCHQTNNSIYSSSSTTKTYDSSDSGAAIFSPKSAANALTSLFTQGTSIPRKMFTDPEHASPTMSCEEKLENGTMGSPAEVTAMLAEPEAPATATKASGFGETTEATPSPPSFQATATMTSTPEGAWKEPTMPPSSHLNQPFNPYQRQFPPGHRHPHHNASPQGVFYPGFFHDGHPAPPSGPWRHPGPWTPIIGGKVHPGPGGTPHQMTRGGPPPQQSFAWDPSRGMCPAMEVSQASLAVGAMFVDYIHRDHCTHCLSLLIPISVTHPATIPHVPQFVWSISSRQGWK
jgi:hypothetical protein